LDLASSIAGVLPPFSFAEQLALPYYDRDLVQFLLSIPRSQILRPGQRRSLMRRALRNKVPGDVLLRKSKGVAQQAPAKEVLTNAEVLSTYLRGTPIARKYVDRGQIEKQFDLIKRGDVGRPLHLERVLGSCMWYLELQTRALLKEHDRGSGSPSP
jgi:asparagine synthase (glutamine-hydrolysing)